jgi:protein-disulfide isomerase
MDLFKLSQEGEDKLKEKLLELGKQAGLNTSQLKKDLESNTYETIINNNIAEGKKVNVSGTPSVFINGYFYGYQPDVIKAKIEEEAKK